MPFNFTAIIIFASFLIFMVLMRVVFFQPLAKIKQTREEAVNRDRQAAEKARADYLSLQTSYEAEITATRKKAQSIIVEAMTQAKKNAGETIGTARHQAAEQVDTQLKALAEWREETYQTLAGERQTLKQLILQKVTQNQAVGSLN